MESTQSFYNNMIKEGAEKFITDINKNPNKLSNEDLIQFLKNLFRKSDQVKFISENIEFEDFLLKNISKCKFSKYDNLFREILFELSKTKLGETIESNIKFSIGKDNANEKKAYLYFEIFSDKKRQIDELSKIQYINNKYEKSLLLLKLDTINPQESKEIIEQLLDLAKPFIDSFNEDLFKPEFKVTTGDYCIFIEISKENNLHFNFYSFLVSSLSERIPEYNFNFKFVNN